MKEFGLYIHIPFCVSKCYYCDFNSFAAKQDLKDRYLSALYQEIELLAEKYSPKIKSIFIGGGTPTSLEGTQLAEILDRCYQSLAIKEDIEITIEANPGTVDKEKLRLIKEAGVNRLSFGVQSFNDEMLRKIGRIHTAQEAIDNYYLAREVGFDNVSLDLIFALPDQSLEDWQNALLQACELEPKHLSTYNLKIEEGTPFYQMLSKGELIPTSEELDLKMYNLTKKLLESKGYQQYEISNFAQRGYESEHNQIYWKNEPYLSLGAGAHFYDGVGRGYNYSALEEYSQSIEEGRLPVKDYHNLTREDEIEETMMLGLRLIKGISLKEFKERFGLSIYEIYNDELDKFSQQKLITITNDRLALTWQGILLANQVLADFMLT
ncbi:oxygen-independent coproporphyrinogen-3 oxidase [Orenia metallireducens]|jgi:oxygen-independent coproporphyrinogen-3 oxidase|uniref:Heme chaperone HemW n=1 Tax=Orenia metallireducens TaxID=1413210 RepID=A0A285G5E0_9FIRM|nr:radical SAM family heme chaperone HemW [Orenia metallireducens]PRX28353.1 oxygen-independent coproporphyrinogen-3 oxidase [Orenia metallireducens]SNY18759.1 oxygen-independent coproporphyrinogen-3 oxidase [Orenia metallireducens]